MFTLIKNDKYDNLVSNLTFYLYFIFQFAFVTSGTAIVRINQSTYKFSTLFMIIPFILIALCDLYNFLRGKFDKIEFLIYVLVGIILLASFLNYRNVMVLANLIIISTFRDADGKRALKCYLFATISAFIVALILGLVFPNIGNVIQMRDGVEKERLGVGFFYASLGQFYYLSIVLAYILYKEEIKVYEYIMFIVIDIILFKFTDTKAPFFYTILSLILFFFVNKFKHTFIFDLFGIISVISTPIGFIGMTLMSLFFSFNNKALAFINKIVNGRLYLTHNSLVEFGVKLFGQTQPKALGDPHYYLDSSMMVLLILFGLAVSLVCICLMTYFAYISYKTKKITILIVIFIIAIRGMFDLGFMAIQFSPVVLFFIPTLKEYLRNTN